MLSVVAATVFLLILPELRANNKNDSANRAVDELFRSSIARLERDGLASFGQPDSIDIAQRTRTWQLSPQLRLIVKDMSGVVGIKYSAEDIPSEVRHVRIEAEIYRYNNANGKWEKKYSLPLADREI